MTSKDVKPLLLGVGERRETKDSGPGGSPGKNRPRALRGLRRPKISLRNRDFLEFLKFS